MHIGLLIKLSKPFSGANLLFGLTRPGRPVVHANLTCRIAYMFGSDMINLPLKKIMCYHALNLLNRPSGLDTETY